MKIQAFNIEGKKTDQVDLSEKIFSVKENKFLIQSILHWQLNRFKPRTAKTKQRNEIKGSTAKIYAQKGTGGARHSSRKAPIFVGGGIAHGPKGAVYRLKKTNKKSRKIALFQVLSLKNNKKSLHVVEDFKVKVNKTKDFYNFLSKNNLSNSLIISDKDSKVNIFKSAQNIPNIKIIEESGANIYDLLKYKNVIFTKSSIKSFQERVFKWVKLIY